MLPKDTHEVSSPCDCTAGLHPRKYLVFWINCALLHEKPCLRHLVMSVHTNTQNLEMTIHLTWQHKALGPENLRITTLETRGKKEAKGIAMLLWKV